MTQRSGASTLERLGAEAERRTSRRYELQAPVLFVWEVAGSGDTHQGRGFTCNLSSQGAYVQCGHELPVLDSRITLEILLPSLGSGSDGLTLKADGIVVRSGREDEIAGFAVAANLAYNERTTDDTSI